MPPPGFRAKAARSFFGHLNSYGCVIVGHKKMSIDRLEKMVNQEVAVHRFLPKEGVVAVMRHQRSSRYSLLFSFFEGVQF